MALTGIPDPLPGAVAWGGPVVESGGSGPGLEHSTGAGTV